VASLTNAKKRAAQLSEERALLSPERHGFPGRGRGVTALAYCGGRQSSDASSSSQNGRASARLYTTSATSSTVNDVKAKGAAGTPTKASPLFSRTMFLLS
jgi:hypothetical protein